MTSGVDAGAAKVAETTSHLERVAEAVEGARHLGLQPQVPASLVAACRRLIAAAGGPAETHRSLQLVPVRQAVLLVLEPGEEATVEQIVERLATQGLALARTQVSNALGYHTTRGRVVRLSRGRYRLLTVPAHGGAGQRDADSE